MSEHFLCLLAIFTFFMTIQSDTHSDNMSANEDQRLEKWFYDYPPNNEPIRIWKIKQRGDDSEDNGNISTGVTIMAAQTSWTHSLWAYASFQSSYEYSGIEGNWYLKAELDHDWATDEKPYKKTGQIIGQAGGMQKSGDQSDIDYFANHDPFETKKDCDAYARAIVYHPSKDIGFRSVSYAHFHPAKFKWEYEKRP